MSKKIDEELHKTRPPAFHALHMVYHERDFRVRVNDPTIGFVYRILLEEVKDELEKRPDHKPEYWNCPACAAGYDFLYMQPNDEDRKR
jgi:hypothetical protein